MYIRRERRSYYSKFEYADLAEKPTSTKLPIVV
jgi:hypothetical protein